ncbi:hypothetical protein [Burkholderia gladioli]|uniref:hypothetical protein n=1 Tax=Burkholderia gladioli TaxID=28095 RepID=UPI0016409659|nr:hypothetical protein [Burkholderia gladioli]
MDDNFENARANAQHAHGIAKDRKDEVLMGLAAAFIAIAKGLDEQLTAIHDRLEQIEDVLRNESGQ